MADITPGPWMVDDGEIVTVAPKQGRKKMKDHVVCFGHDYDDYGAIYNEADANLIAAAPDLLEAAEAAERYFAVLRFVLKRHRGARQLDALRSAIRKAKGEKQW